MTRIGQPSSIDPERRRQLVRESALEVTTQGTGLIGGAALGAAAAKYAPSLLPPVARSISSPVAAAAVVGGSILGAATMVGYYARRLHEEPTAARGFWAGSFLAVTLMALHAMNHLPLVAAALGAAAGGYGLAGLAPNLRGKDKLQPQGA